MSSRRTCTAVALGVLLLAGGLRFYRLGDWSFAVDEVATLQEADELLDGRPLTDNPLSRLPRIVPVSYLLHGYSFRLLGRSEFAARLPAALLGTALCGLVVVGLSGPLGGRAAAATGLLVALNPEYVFYSQYNRFYAVAAIFAAGAVLAAAAALRTRSVGWMAAAAACAAVGTFAHTLIAGLFAGLAVAACLTPTGETRGRRGMALVVAVAALAVALVGGLYVLPLLRGWNAAVGWGYPVRRSVLSGVNALGWPTVLLAGLGAVQMFARRDPRRWFWGIWACGWPACIVVLPMVITYQPAYSFLFALGPMVLAGYAVGGVAEALQHASGRGPAAAWVAVAVLANLPVLASHYVDGSRPDQRAAAAFVAERRRPGEGVYAVSPGYLAYYRPGSLDDAEPLAVDGLPASFRAVEAGGKPAWLVVPAGRSGREPAAQAWLNARCRLEATFRKTRYDYSEFTLDVYRFEPR